MSVDNLQTYQDVVKHLKKQSRTFRCANILQQVKNIFIRKKDAEIVVFHGDLVAPGS